MAKKPCNFPNSLDNLVEDRKPGDVVTSDSYDVIENAINALERKVGINGSLDPNSHEYKIAHKANKPPSSTAGNLASLDSNGNLQDSGYKPTDFTTQDDISNKANKVLGAVNDNFVALKSDGDIKDSGKKAADFANVVHTHTGADIISEVSNADMVDGKHASEFEPVIPIKGTAFNKDFGTAEDTVCEGNDERLYDDRPPTPHAPTHITGGSDTIPDAVAGGNSGLMSGADKANLDSAVSLKHTQGTDTTLGTMTADINMNSHKLTNLAAPSAAGDSIRQTTKITEANLEDAIDKKHKIYISTSEPSGGSDGDVWFKYTVQEGGKWQYILN